MSGKKKGRGRKASTAEAKQLRRRVDELERALGEKPVVQRAYWGGKTNRTTSGMASQPRPTNMDIQQGLRALRARSRELAQNSDHVKGFIRQCRSNVAGPSGLRLRARVPDNRGPGIDGRAGQSIEAAWASQSKMANFTASGTIGRVEMEGIHIATIARDGEAIYRKRPGWAGSQWRYAIEPIDAELLDVTLNRPIAPDREIRMGVEIDPTFRPIAYHFGTTNIHTYDYSFNGRNYIRIPASEIIHCFIREDAQQVRGVPWTAAGIIRLNMLSHYEDSAVTGSRMGASKMGFYEQDREAAALMADQREAAEETGQTDALGNVIEEVDPGFFEVLPPGVNFKPFDPGYPNTAHSEFVSACLRSISVGLGVSYSSIAGDYGSGSWSSLREESNNERALWIMLQNWVAETFDQVIYEGWLENALLVGIPVIGTTNGLLRPEDRQRYESVIWQGRRWRPSDPQKEMAGYGMGISLGGMTVSQMIRDFGGDPQEVFEERARELEEMERLDIPTTDYFSHLPTDPEELDETEPASGNAASGAQT